jgi:DNA-binding PadR family transcriptional regulator
MSEPEHFLPLKPIELLILTVLSAGNRHGYGIRQDILEQTNGSVAVEAGNLYRHLRGLEDDDLVGEVPPPKSETDERRLYYRLTPLGKRVLAAEMQRLRALVNIAEERGIIARSRA